MDILSIIINLIGGAIGANATGSAMGDKNLGTLGNTIAGLIGGPLGGYLMQAFGFIAQSGITATDIESILANLVSGGAGGGVLMAIVGILKKYSQK